MSDMEASPLSTVTVFEGKVTSTGVETRDGGQPELVVVAEDLAYELSRSARAATYLNVKASEIIAKVVSSSGASHQVDDTESVLAYTLQTDTDLAFIDELCRRNGLDWEVDATTFRAWTSHNGSKLSEAAARPVARLELGTSLREFSAKVYGDAPQSVTVRGWDHLNKEAVVGEATFTRTGVPDGLAALLAASSIKAATVLDAQAGPLDPSDATTLAKVASTATGTVLARGTCYVAPALRPGVTVTVADAGPASGSYYVREVEHTYRPSGFHTTFVAGDRDPGSLVASQGAPVASSFRHDGVVVGLVSAISDDPDNAGRVKVSLPGLDSTIESQWARLAVLGGGAKRGMVFLPEVHDEVLVAFEGGGEALTALQGGHVQVYFGDASEAHEQMKAGAKIRVLAVMADQRLEGDLSKVPTAKEQGLDVEWPIIRGFYLGPKVSDADYKVWVDTFNRLMATPAFKSQREQMGLFPFSKTGADLDAFVKQRVGVYRKMAGDFGLNVAK